MEQFKQAARILRTLRENGFEAYFVGGSVRDYLLQRPIGDIDIATAALPEEVMRLFPKHVPVGLQHGTVVVLQEGIPYEVTTFRTEAGYEDFRRPSEVVFVRSLTEDLKRRDFTMNAIAMREDGTIVDPFCGRQALERRLIETVGQADERFQEDALRMMRGIRFVSTLDFTLCPRTETAIRTHRHLLQHIAVERMAVEFTKLLLGPAVSQALQLLVQTKLHEHLPLLEQKGEELLEAAGHNWAGIQTETEAWALIIWMAKADAEDVCRQWKLPNRRLKEILEVLRVLQQRLNQPLSAYLLYQAGEETAMMAERLLAAVKGTAPDAESIRRLYKQLPMHSRQDMQVTGRDILSWSDKPAGPWVADCLAAAEREIVSGSLVNEKERIKGWLKQCNLL
ncbi:CCA tRNA nucleotidyltransferase [Ectobacillus ponti]|uniref:CCA-adding enzyme n=1 Tax=Ectobacillus ponti TaxID=2961894 RepID=A0AA41X7V3_9BACI|nr:CCA tRNA nucleotidyltransferase [Ectobacillus ponti]MCP8968778.1 CCA tRNA nucleotidyltransferase [Ectobacillus ponti]